MAPTMKRQMNWGCFLICWAVSLGQIAFGYPGIIDQYYSEDC